MVNPFSFLKTLKWIKKAPKQLWEVVFFFIRNIVFLLNTGEMLQYWSNIDDESVTPWYEKPSLEPSAPFDSPALCPMTGRSFTHPVPSCGSLYPFNSGRGFVDHLAGRAAVLEMEILMPHSWGHLVINFLGQLRSSFQTKTMLFACLRWSRSPH